MLEDRILASLLLIIFEHLENITRAAEAGAAATDCNTVTGQYKINDSGDMHFSAGHNCCKY